MLILTGRLICADAEQAERVRAHLPDHIRLTRAETGCISFEVTPSHDPLIWLVEERFASRAAFEAHQARLTTSDWGRATVGIRRDYQIDEDE